MTNNTIAKRYAKALVQLGAENSLVDSFRTELASVDTLFKANAALKMIFADPALKLGQKKAIMGDLVVKLACSELVGNFLMLLVDKNRVCLLPDVVDTFEKLADDFSGIIRPTVKSAFPLDEGQVDSIRKALEARSGRKVVLEVLVDNTLVGGLVTQIGDIAYDNSVKTQLKRIEDILQKG